jgi:hypothetical protein
MTDKEDVSKPSHILYKIVVFYVRKIDLSKVNVVAHVCNSSTQEAEAERITSSRLHRVPGYMVILCLKKLM